MQLIEGASSVAHDTFMNAAFMLRSSPAQSDISPAIF